MTTSKDNANDYIVYHGGENHGMGTWISGVSLEEARRELRACRQVCGGDPFIKRASDKKWIEFPPF